MFEKHFIKQTSRVTHSQFLLKAPLSELVDNPLAIFGDIEQIYIPKLLLCISPLPIFQVQAQLLSFISLAGPSTPLDLVLSVVTSIDPSPCDYQTDFLWQHHRVLSWNPSVPQFNVSLLLSSIH